MSMYFEGGKMADKGSESEARGLNTMGNPQVSTRESSLDERGDIGQCRPGGILARGSASSFRRDMGGAARGSELLRRGGR